MVNLPEGKKAYIPFLIITLLLSAGSMIMGAFLNLKDAGLTTFGIADSTALATFILSLIVLAVIIKGSDRTVGLTLIAWFAYFVISQFYLFWEFVFFLVKNLGMGTLAEALPSIAQNPLAAGPVLFALGFGLLMTICVLWLGIRLFRFYLNGHVGNRFYNVVFVLILIFAALILAAVILVLVSGAAFPARAVAGMFTILGDVTLLSLFTVFMANLGKAKLQK